MREERGETIVELLVAFMVAGLILWAAMQLLVTSTNIAARDIDRSEAVQRGRLALDRVTTVLGSQVCLGANTPPVQDATATSVSVISGIASGTAFAPSLHQFTLDTVNRKLVETTTNGVGTPPNTTFTGTVKSATLVADVAAPSGAAMFRYYAFDPVLGAQQLDELTPPLTAADRARVVRITVAMTIRPVRTHGDDARATTLDAGVGPASMEPSLDWQLGPRCA